MQPTITNWNVNPQDIGPMYPLVGWEMPMFIACAAFCIGFMVWKFVTENAKYESKVQQLRARGVLSRALADDPLNRQQTPTSRQPDEE